MISKAINSITRVINQNERPRKAYSLALFRILFSIHTLFTVYFTHVYKGLIFDSIAGITKNPFPFNTFLSIWGISAFLMLVGTGTRIISVVNYFCVVIAYELFWRSGVLSYYDDLLLMGSFLCIFLPVARTLSIDAAVKRILTGNTEPSATSRLTYIAFIILCLGLMYFGSGVSKLVSPIWQKGIGLWIPMSMPFFKWNAIPGYFADYEVILKSLNYLTIAWEILFLPMLLNKRLRTIAIITGFIFHTGIGLFFHFPMEALGTLVFYALFIPDEWWAALLRKLAVKKQIQVIIPKQHITALRAWALLKSIDYRNRFAEAQEITDNTVILSSPQSFIKLLKTYVLYLPFAWLLQSGAYHGVLNFVKNGLTSYQVSLPNLTYRFKRNLLIRFIIFLSLIQCYLSARHVIRKLLSNQSAQAVPVSLSPPPKTLNPTWLTRSLFGMNGRGLFLDNALSITRTVYSVSYSDNAAQTNHFFPFANMKGFVVNDLHMDGTATRPFSHYLQNGNDLSVEGLQKILLYRFSKQPLPFKEYEFTILKRTYTPPVAFEPGYWLKMQDLQWDTAGTAYWQNDTFRYIPYPQNTFSGK